MRCLVTILLVVPILGACESYFASKRDITGGFLCDVLGHPIIDATARTAATEGTPLGAFLGSRIGRRVPLIDELKTAEALESSCDGRASTWRNADTEDRYSVTPVRTYRTQSARCRDFTAVTDVRGHEQVIHATACRQPDGTWKARSR